MALALTAEQKELIKIFKIEEQYIIPAYQRPYSWEYDECFQLYNDVIEALKNNEDYFIGNIVIARSDNCKDKLEVIDGQQRLTTLLLFMKVLSIFAPDHKALRDCLQKEDWESDDKEPRIKSEIFEAKDGEEFKAVLQFTENDFEEKLKTFKDAKGNFIVSKFKNRFERNSLFFYSWIQYFISQDNDLKEFIAFLLRRIYLLPIELSGATFDDAREKALKIFETLNNRGKSLNDADIFKAKLYNKAQKLKEENIFIDAWTDLKNRCDLLNIKIDDVFRYYSHVIRGREGKTSLEINIRDFFTKMDYSPFNLKNYNEILDELFSILEVLSYIHQEKNKPTELAKWLQLVEIYTNQYPKLALVVYLFVNKEDKKGLVGFLKKLIRFTYFAGSTSTIKFSIFNIIRDVSIKKEIEEFIRNDISQEYFDYLGLLKNGYALLAFYLTQENALVSFNIDKLINYKDEPYLTNWTKQQIEDIANSLGNFIILDIPKRDLTFDKKMNYYKESQIEEVQKLSENLLDFSFDDFKGRDKKLKETLFRFFKGEI